ncbi:TetR family transcriptional regulator [Modestobacter versicolor]|uniref:TetR family transcriptional regulator n=1 Tax=Modestobacter versicolor TaxID=429133 RepID=UPI0034DE2BB5
MNAGTAGRRDRRDSRWDEHRRVRREQLVDATLAAVGRHGAGVGMEEIAAAAGTSKAVVYRHFADRSELHVAVCARVAEQLTRKLREAIGSSSDPRQMVAAAVDTYLTFIEADPAVYRFVVTHSPAADDGSDPISSLSDLVGAEVGGLVAGFLVRAGQDPAPAAPWGHGLIGLVRAAADWWLRADRPIPRAQLATHLTAQAWSGLRGVVGPTAPPATAPPATAPPATASPVTDAAATDSHVSQMEDQ